MWTEPAPRGARIVILGTDTMLAALPATSVQIAHACHAAGFDVAIPASWGDELVADACLRELGTREGAPVIQCSCPCVARRLTTEHGELARFLLPLDPPPLAAARYVRALYVDTAVHVTYAGACPSGADPLIDRHLEPAAFLAELAERGISLGDQPAIFESILPPDRRRHRSLPGGVPTPDALLDERDRRLVEISAHAFAAELAETLLAHRDVLIDIAPRLGCACSGSVETLGPGNARSVVTSLEPPRSATPVVDARFGSTRRPTPRDVAIIPGRGATVPPRADDERRAADDPASAPPEQDASRAAGSAESLDAQSRDAIAGEAAAREAADASPRGSRQRAFPLGDGPIRRPPLLTPRSSAATFPLTRRPDGAPLPRTYALSRAVSGRHRAVPDPGARYARSSEETQVERDRPVAADRTAPEAAAGYGADDPPILLATPPASHAPPDETIGETSTGDLSATRHGHPQTIEAADASAAPAPNAAADTADEQQPHDRHPLLAEAEFEAFLTDIRATVAETVAEWRLTLRSAIVRWREAGYSTTILERALGLPRQPDVAGLIRTFTAAVEHLAELEARALHLAPQLAESLAAHPVFRDPARVADAEAVVERIAATLTPPAPAPTPEEALPALVWDWPTFEDCVIEELGTDALSAGRGWSSHG